MLEKVSTGKFLNRPYFLTQWGDSQNLVAVGLRVGTWWEGVFENPNVCGRAEVKRKTGWVPKIALWLPWLVPSLRVRSGWQWGEPIRTICGSFDFQQAFYFKCYFWKIPPGGVSQTLSDLKCSGIQKPKLIQEAAPAWEYSISLCSGCQRNRFLFLWCVCFFCLAWSTWVGKIGNSAG